MDRDAAIAAGLAIGAIAVGFLVGFTVGQGTRNELGGATDASLEGGVLTVRVDGTKALAAGLRQLLR